MSVLDVIYNAYCEGKFTVRMPEHTASDKVRLMSIEEMFNMTPLQIEEFEKNFLEIFNDAMKSGFYAGFRTAVRLVSE